MTQETTDALEEFKAAVNTLSYIVNNVGVNDSFDRTMARNSIDKVEIAFNTYIKTLTNEDLTFKRRSQWTKVERKQL